MVGAGQSVPFVLSHGPSFESPPAPIDPFKALERTEAFWRQWSDRCPHVGPWTDAVKRSLITLKALTYAPMGGIVAAATTSLPERSGGVRYARPRRPCREPLPTVGPYAPAVLADLPLSKLGVSCWRGSCAHEAETTLPAHANASRAGERCKAMTVASEHIAPSSSGSSSKRVRRFRERRKHGLRFLTVTVPETVIEDAVTRGLLAAQDRAAPWSVVQSCYAAQLSDAALEWLINSGVIKREQRGDAVEVLRSISRWPTGSPRRASMRCITETTLRPVADVRARNPRSH